jgi:hypothetical protein
VNSSHRGALSATTKPSNNQNDGSGIELESSDRDATALHKKYTHKTWIGNYLDLKINRASPNPVRVRHCEAGFNSGKIFHDNLFEDLVYDEETLTLQSHTDSVRTSVLSRFL